MRTLHEATEALTEARTPAEIAKATVTLGAEAVDALAGALWLEESDGSLVMQASHNVLESELSAWQRVPASADLPLCRVLRTGRTAWVSCADDHAREAPEAFDATRAANRGWSYVALPLTDGQKSVGVLWFSYGGNHVFSEDEQRFLRALARMCEHALDRARLFVAVAEASLNKNEIVAMLGHELRNPLAAMVMAMDLLKVRDPRLNRELSILDRQLAHLVHLVGDLVDVSRITRGQIKLRRKTVDVAGAVEHAIDTSRATIDELGHQISVEVPPHLLVDADRERIGQVLANLVNNAVKYTPPHGRIAITAHRDGDFVEITVSDNGVGITPTLMPQLFDMFVQGERGPDRHEGGLGVGLTVVRTLVELHGGAVAVTSDGPGKGSRFTVRWPRATRDTVTTRMPALKVSEARRLRVLIVDDNEDAAVMLGALVMSMGHDVIIEHDSETALKTAEQSGPHVALVDVGCPGIDGYHLARRLRMLPSLKSTSLIAMTRHGQTSDQERGDRADFSHHLAKPIVLSVLQSVLAPLLEPLE